VPIRLNQIMHGWANHFKHAVAKHTFYRLARFAWRRVIGWLMTQRRWTWKDVRRWLQGPNGSWLPIYADGVELINLASRPAVTRYCEKTMSPICGS
jgi:RNA-directed DNA polymerase